jgi:GNAT superfamily N-acetyltransferase
MALELKRLWVRRGFRGLALGRRLMQAAIDAARAAGAGAVYLDTVPAAMPEANRLYEAMGFERVERYNDNDVADIAFFRLGL